MNVWFALIARGYAQANAVPDGLDLGVTIGVDVPFSLGGRRIVGLGMFARVDTSLPAQNLFGLVVGGFGRVDWLRFGEPSVTGGAHLGAGLSATPYNPAYLPGFSTSAEFGWTWRPRGRSGLDLGCEMRSIAVGFRFSRVLDVRKDGDGWPSNLPEWGPPVASDYTFALDAGVPILSFANLYYQQYGGYYE